MIISSRDTEKVRELDNLFKFCQLQIDSRKSHFQSSSQNVCIK